MHFMRLGGSGRLRHATIHLTPAKDGIVFYHGTAQATLLFRNLCSVVDLRAREDVMEAFRKGLDPKQVDLGVMLVFSRLTPPGSPRSPNAAQREPRSLPSSCGPCSMPACLSAKLSVPHLAPFRSQMGLFDGVWCRPQRLRHRCPASCPS